MILVTGTGRSGTTFTARCLREQLGVDMGRDLDASAEDPEFRQLLANAWNRRWGAQRLGDALQDYFQERTDRAETANAPVWGVKDPRLSDFLPQVLPLLPCADIVWCWRQHDQVVESWTRVTASNAAQARERIDLRMHHLLELEPENVQLAHECMWDRPNGCGAKVLRLDFTRKRDRPEIVEKLARLPALHLDRSPAPG